MFFKKDYSKEMAIFDEAVCNCSKEMDRLLANYDGMDFVTYSLIFEIGALAAQNAKFKGKKEIYEKQNTFLEAVGDKDFSEFYFDMKRKYDAAIGLGKIPEVVLNYVNLASLPEPLDNQIMRCSVVACYPIMAMDAGDGGKGLQSSFYYTILACNIYKAMEKFYVFTYSGFKK